VDRRLEVNVKKYLIIALGATAAVLILLFATSANLVTLSLPAIVLLAACPVAFIVFSIIDILNNRRFYYLLACLPPLGVLAHAILTDRGAIDNNPDSSILAWTLFLLVLLSMVYLAVFIGLYVFSIIVRLKRKDKKRFQPV
jgi:hypothetical protein